MDFNNIKQQGYWKDTANTLNDNFNKIAAEMDRISELTERGKGMFITLTDLQTAYPRPNEGDWALVGTSLPATVYVGKNGQWTPSGGTGGNGSIDLNGYLKSERITDITEILDGEIYPLVIELKTTPDPVEFTGTEQRVTVSWDIKKNDIPATVSRVLLTQDGVNLDASVTANGSKEAIVNKDGSITFRLEAVADGKASASYNYLQMVRPMYFGFSNAESGVQFSALEKQAIKTEPSGTYSITNGNAANYMWLCVPSSMVITSVKVGGTGIPLQSPELVQSNSYRCYRSTSAYATVGKVTIEVE